MQATANLARTVGWALQPIRPGRQAFATRRRAFAAVPGAIKVSSPAFIEPRGHGPHRYAFQIFALDNVPQFDWPPGREHLLRAIRPHVIGRGILVGIYQRK